LVKLLACWQFHGLYVWYTNEAGGSVEVPCETLSRALVKLSEFA
jgi:hypothetical protein